MIAPTLWIEITMAGAVYVAAMWFFILGEYRLDAIQRLAEIGGYLPSLAVIRIGASYTVGIVMHRVTQALAILYSDCILG